MSKLEELLNKECPDGVEYKLFSDVAVYIRGVTYSKSKEINNNYEKEFWQILRANNIDLHSNTLNFDDIKKINKDVKINENQFLYANDIIICAGSGSKEHIGKVAFIYNDIPYSFGGFMGVIRTNESILLSRYLFHILTSSIFKNHLNFNMYSTTINNLSSQIMNSLKIPIPPIEVQKEIVRILDEFTEKTTKLQELLHRETILRKKQYEYYRNYLFNKIQSYNNVLLGDIADISVGSKPEFISENKAEFEYINAGTTNSGYTNNYNCLGDTVTTPSRGQGGIGYIGYQKNNFWLGALCYQIRSNKDYILTKYIYYYLKNNNELILKIKNSGGLPSVNRNDLIKINIKFPDLEYQKEIINILDRFDTLCNDITSGLPAEIEMRKKQYEYYRDKLLTFKEKKK